MSAAASELLSFQVIQGEQVVTYRRLSNELQIHINEAKRLMAAFYDDHKDRCHATFALTGVRKREMCDDLLASELLVALVDESELSVLKSDLENAEYHVYSLEPRAMQDRNALIAANVSCGNMRDAAELGAIRSSVSVLANAASTSANAYSREPTKHAAVVKGEAKPKSTPKQDGGEDVAMEEARPVSSKKTALATSEKEGGKGGNANDRATSSVNKTKSAKSFFGRHIPKKPASSTESAAIPDEDRGIVKQEAKQEFKQEAKTEQQPEKRQIDSQEQVPESEDMGMQSAEEAEPPVKRPRVEDMFDDDDSSDFVDGFKSPSAKPAKDDGSDAMDDSQQSMASAAETQSDVEMAEPVASTSTKEDDQSAIEKGRRRVRKQRKVSRIKHTKNKRGMLVSQTVEEWESYSESESDRESAKSKSALKKQPAASAETSDTKKNSSKSKSKSAAAPQKSILSFFGKKK